MNATDDDGLPERGVGRRGEDRHELGRDLAVRDGGRGGRSGREQAAAFACRRETAWKA